MGLQSVISYSIEDAKQYYMGLVGQGPALDAFARVMDREDFATAFPRAKVIGWVPTPGRLPDDDSIYVPTILRHKPLFADVPSLFAACPGIQLAVDLSADSRYMESLRAYAPAAVSLCTSGALLRFCSASEDGRLAIGGGESLRKAQKLFALLVDQVDGDILIMDGEGTILDVNHHAAETRGMTRSQLIGKTCADLDIPLRFCFDDEPNCPYHEAKNTGKPAEHTFAQVMSSGRVRYINAVCFPVADALGAPSQYLYIRRDVTEKQHLEQRLQQTEKMAAIGELSTYMAHEIRNPLFSIGGFANALLRNPSLNDLAREKARIIYDESRRLDVILTSILNFARPTEQAMGEFDAATVARQTIELMTLGSEERGITVVLDIEAGLPKASGNAENLKQCLINLVKNALEAMPNGGVLTLRAGRQDSYVHIVVEDNGKGIPANIQEQIFSPFYTTKNSGAGLGLAMTRKVIEEMGGKVFLESQPGKGTRITLLVPVALAVEEQEEGSLSGESDDLDNGDTARQIRDMTETELSGPAGSGELPESQSKK